VDEFGVLADLGAGAVRSPRSLGVWAVQTGVLTAEQLQGVYATWDERGEAPGEMFVRRGWMTEQMVADALGELSGIPVVRAVQRSEDPDVLGALSAEEAWRLEACPLERDGEGSLVVALADPSEARLRALEARLGSSICPVIVMNSELKALLDGPQASGGTSDEATPSLTAAAEDGGEADTEAHHAAPSTQAGAADRPDNAPERVGSVTFTLEPAGDPAAETEQLERLHERLVSEHVQSTDELVAYRRQFTEIAEERARVQRNITELAEEQARVQRSITALEAKLGEEELVLSLINAKLTELSRSGVPAPFLRAGVP
jgi:chemotaxis protein histidine kinase CheA